MLWPDARAGDTQAPGLTARNCFDRSVKKKSAKEDTEAIRKVARRRKIDVVGIADLRALDGIGTEPHGLLGGYAFGISLAVALDGYGRYDSSTEDEFSFPPLDKAAEEIRDFIASRGHKAKVIPTDELLDDKPPLRWKGSISHKALGKAAGIGWIGRSSLLVTHEFGPRVCLASVLTDMPLEPGRPQENLCGSCRKCIDACPQKALRLVEFDDHPESIEELINRASCEELVESKVVGPSICYECMLVCPRGRGREKR